MKEKKCESGLSTWMAALWRANNTDVKLYMPLEEKEGDYRKKGDRIIRLVTHWLYDTFGETCQALSVSVCSCTRDKYYPYSLCVKRI